MFTNIISVIQASYIKKVIKFKDLYIAIGLKGIYTSYDKIKWSHLVNIGICYDMIEANNRLYIASIDGLYMSENGHMFTFVRKYEYPILTFIKVKDKLLAGTHKSILLLSNDSFASSSIITENASAQSFAFDGSVVYAGDYYRGLSLSHDYGSSWHSMAGDIGLVKYTKYIDGVVYVSTYDHHLYEIKNQSIYNADINNLKVYHITKYIDGLLLVTNEGLMLKKDNKLIDLKSIYLDRMYGIFYNTEYVFIEEHEMLIAHRTEGLYLCEFNK